MSDIVNFFDEFAPRLLAKGYLPIPIKPGDKRPAMDSWQHARLTAADARRFPQHGVGILTGQGEHPIAAIDIDTRNVALVQDVVHWCLRTLGQAPIRVGLAPKALLVYRAAASWRKSTSRWFDHPSDLPDEAGKLPGHRLEVLGSGQQFVAFGIHPTTGQPYSWNTAVGDLSRHSVLDLPIVTEEQVLLLQSYWVEACRRHGLAERAAKTKEAVVGEALLEGATAAEHSAGPLGDVPLERAARYLQRMDPFEYDTWLHCGMVLHHEYGGSPEALALWDQWSSQAANYIGFEDLAKRWEGFGRTGRTSLTMRWLIKTANTLAEQEQLANARELHDQLVAMVEGCDDSTLLRTKIATDLGHLTQHDGTLRAEAIVLVRSRYRALTGSLLPMAEVRRLVGGESDTRAAGTGVGGASTAVRPTTERGLAERMVDAHAESLRYVADLQRWIRWNGSRWVECTKKEIEGVAQQTLDGLWAEAAGIEDTDARALFRKWVTKSQNYSTVKNMTELAMSDPRVIIMSSRLDSDVTLWACSNGVIDLTTGQLHEAKPEDLITLGTPVEFDRNATCPLWEQTLLEVHDGDQERVHHLQVLMGYTMLGDPKESLLLIPWGNGANGKSTVFSVLSYVFGDYSKTCDASSFTAAGRGYSQAGGAAREDLLRLRGARLVYISEPEDSATLREAFVKSMTGGESLVARGIRAEKSAEFVPTWVPIMPTNHRPIVRGDDHGIWRRLMPLPFTRNFDKDPTAKKDVNRARRLRAESAGILNWLLRGALEYLETGLPKTASVDEAREEYRGSMDVLAGWLEERCTVDERHDKANSNLWATSEMLFMSWKAYAEMRGELHFIRSQRALSNRLLSRGFVPQVKKDDGKAKRVWCGLKLQEIADE